MRILGIDPAWAIDKNPSGIALVEGDSSLGWKCVVLESLCPSDINADYFLCQLLDRFEKVDCLVLDIPLSQQPTSGRRKADKDISQCFGSQHCSTHSPSEYVYNIGLNLLNQAKERGYVLNKSIIETYPHPAILKLLKLQYRLQYKVKKTAMYWPKDSIEKRLNKVKCKMKNLKDAIQNTIKLPTDFVFDNISSFNKLKPFEDMLDALVCAWVGIEFISNNAIPYGDENGKIWVPK